MLPACVRVARHRSTPQFEPHKIGQEHPAGASATEPFPGLPPCQTAAETHGDYTQETPACSSAASTMLVDLERRPAATLVAGADFIGRCHAIATQSSGHGAVQRVGRAAQDAAERVARASRRHLAGMRACTLNMAHSLDQLLGYLSSSSGLSSNRLYCTGARTVVNQSPGAQAPAPSATPRQARRARTRREPRQLTLTTNPPS